MRKKDYKKNLLKHVQIYLIFLLKYSFCYYCNYVAIKKIKKEKKSFKILLIKSVFLQSESFTKNLKLGFEALF